MAELESWEAAAEFDIPQDMWAGYQVRRRADDLYVASFSAVFDALRLLDKEQQESELASIAKTLVIYSHSAAAKYLNGVERRLNQLYSAALYYLAGQPATASFLAARLEKLEDVLDEESFLLDFLKRKISKENPFSAMLSNVLYSNGPITLGDLKAELQKEVRSGLEDNPRKFVGAKLALCCIERFEKYNAWDSLRKHASNYSSDLWRPFLGNAQAYPLWEFLPSQLIAIEAGLLGDVDETYSLQMPTSAGKTSLCELLIYHEVMARKKRVLFLVPFRALAAEIRDGMSRRLSNAGIKVIASHGGNIPTRSETATIEDADVLIITPEKFTALAQVVPELENQYQTIICDEGHLIDDNSRGLQYELLLTKLKGKESASRKMIFISAILPNVNEIHEWLGGQPGGLAKSVYRPVTTDFAFLTPHSHARNEWQLDVNPIYERPRSYFLMRFLVQDDFRYVNPATGRAKLIDGWNTNLSLACASTLKARRNGSVALFTTSRGDNGIRGLARKLIALCETKVAVAKNGPPSSDLLPDLVEYISFQFGENYLLSRLLKFGAGFHHGQLPQEVRREMEEGIQNGAISILLCTNTLAEGVNLPIRTLVVHTVRRYSSENWVYLPNRSIKNIVGRAGRAGKETRGRVIFINETERILLESVVRDEAMESARGALYKLVKAISDHIANQGGQLSNDFFDQQEPWFLNLIDSIDSTLLGLIPSETPQEEINQQIEELLEQTLANRYCNTEQLRDCIQTVFRLRAEKLQQSVARDTWPILRKSGVSLRFWTFVMESGLLEHESWGNLADSLDSSWMSEVVLRLKDFSGSDIDEEQGVLIIVICGWMSGLTYEELAGLCGREIDDILGLICNTVGYHLQDRIAKLCQLAIEHHGEDDISDVARNWASLLQYGLKTMQQLDMFERGASDRLAVWGVSRFLEKNHIDYRGEELMAYLRLAGDVIRTELEQDSRVPRMSVERLCRELRFD